MIVDDVPRKYEPEGRIADLSFIDTLGVAVELRSHTAGRVISDFTAEHTELIVDPIGNRTRISRSNHIEHFDDASLIGRAWITPAKMHEDHVTLTHPMEQCIHVYLADTLFDLNGLDVKTYGFRLRDLPYTTLEPDNLITEIARSLRHELLYPSSVRKLFMQTLTCSLAARLSQRYIDLDHLPTRHPDRGLDHQRLSRVTDYIDANLVGNISLDGLASVACLSQFHFARAFKAATGQSPHQFVRNKRMARAKALLAATDMPLIRIAFDLGFSNQANFSRAFQRNVGVSPGAFRKLSRKSAGPFKHGSV